MQRKKYLVVFDVNTGEWVNSMSELTRIFVFEAENDDDALKVVASYAKGKKKCTPTFFACITKGIEFKEIDARDKINSLADVAEFTAEFQKQAKFEHFHAGEGMFSQLQPSSPCVS